jgi:hypothetical protein
MFYFSLLLYIFIWNLYFISVILSKLFWYSRLVILILSGLRMNYAPDSLKDVAVWNFQIFGFSVALLCLLKRILEFFLCRTYQYYMSCTPFVLNILEKTCVMLYICKETQPYDLWKKMFIQALHKSCAMWNVLHS